MPQLHPPRRRRSRWLTSLITASGITASLFIATLPARADDTPLNSPGALQQAEIDAATQARTTGQPVPVDAATDAYSTLTAQPDGTFTQSVSASPQRVKQNDAWVPLDATLHRNSDGTYSTNATTAELTLSGGGSTPLAAMDNAGKQLAFTWPTALPAPTVTGSTALYSDVLPGVDLSLQANDRGGFTDIIVVKTAQAALNPALSTLHLATTSTGVNLTADSAGNLTAADDIGAAVFHAPAPQMWDSTTQSGGAQSLATVQDTATPTTDPTEAPSPGAQVAPVDVQVQGSSLDLTPSSSLLTGAGTTFPVYIDPTWVPADPVSRADFTYIQQGYPNTSNWDRDDSNDADGIGVGYQGYKTPNGIERSFYQFNVGTWVDTKHIETATLNVGETYTASFGCTAYNVSAYSMASHITSATTWANFNSPTATLMDTEPIGGAYNNGCAGEFPASFNVAPALASDGDGILTLELRGNESTSASGEFKRFSRNAELVFRYNSIPTVPVNMAATPAPQTAPGATTQGCNSTGPWGWIANGGSGNSVTLAGKVADPDSGANQLVRGQFALWDDSTAGGATAIISMGDAASAPLGSSTGWMTSGQTAAKTVPVSLLTNGHVYGWQMRTDDGIDHSADTTPCHFKYDASAPTNVSINGSGTTSGSCTDGGTLGPAGTPFTFTFAASDSGSGLHHFDYTFDSASVLASDGGTHTAAGVANPSVTSSFPSWGTYYLNVAAVDNAGNESGAVCYSFYLTDNRSAQVTPGDINGDENPDLAAIPKTTFNGPQGLNYYTATQSNARAQIASDASQGPNSDGTWTGAITAHRSTLIRSQAGIKTDDLWALGNTKLLYFYVNSGSGGANGSLIYTTASNGRTAVARPVCDSAITTCTGYATNWAQVQQIAAPGDMNGDGIPDLITEETGSQLWFFPGATTTGKLGSPQLIGSGGWDSYTLITPGNTESDKGVAPLWARNDTTGNVYTYQTTFDTSTGKVMLPAQVLIGINYPASTYPLIISLGDTSGDGMPDLIATNSAGKLVMELGKQVPFLFHGDSGPVEIGNGGWQNISSIS